MVVIKGSKEELEKIKAMLEDNDCKGAYCTKNEMRTCTSRYNSCPCWVGNITFEETN